MTIRESTDVVPARSPGTSEPPQQRHGVPPRAGVAWLRRHKLGVAASGTGLIWTWIMFLRLFAGGAVGMGDQGDGRRLMCQLGIRSTAPFNSIQSSHVYPTWVAHKWYGEACSADGAGGVFRSSQLWLLSAAKHLTPILGLPGDLDLRALGVICAALVGVIVSAFVVMVPGPLAVRVGLASLVGLLAADSMVSQFFISPYSEPAELLGILALCPALLALWRRGRTTWPSLAAVAFLGTLTIGAKTQAAVILPGLVLAVLWLPHRPKPETEPDTNPRQSWLAGPLRFLRWFTARGPGLLVAALLTLSTGYFVQSATGGLSQQDVYAEVFGEILPHSPEPAADLRALGADPRLVYAIGSNPESPNAVTLRLDYLKFRFEVTEASIVKFYLTHPTRLRNTGADGLVGVAHWRQDYLGSYLPDTRHPAGAIENRVDFYGSLFKDRPALVLVLFWFATLYTGIRTAHRRHLGSPGRAVGRLTVFTALSAFLSFWAVMVSVGYPDMFRHMVLTNLLMALGLPLMLGCAVVRIQLVIALDAARLAAGSET